MPFRIIRNDITRMEVDAIVNTSNPKPTYGAGSDRAVYEAAGAERLLAERKKIGEMVPGQAAITRGFALPARYIIHTVGPVWKGGSEGEEETLALCYRNCLELARKKRIRSIAFPLISSGVYGFPKDRALSIALKCFSDFLRDAEMDITLVVFGWNSVDATRKFIAEIDTYIDDHYVEEKFTEEYRCGERSDYPGRDREFADSELCEPLFQQSRCDEAWERRNYSAPIESGRTFARKANRSLDDVLKQQEETFQQMLFRLIREKGYKNVEVYKAALMDKKLFAKIKANPDYKPSKATAFALCIALKLNLDEARDLLGRAGYAFSPSNKTDLIVQFFIEEELYDMFSLEAALFDHDLPQLCHY